MRASDLDVNLSEFGRLDRENGRWLNSRPVCGVCGRRIQETSALRLDGKWICDRCVEDNTEWIEE